MSTTAAKAYLKSDVTTAVEGQLILRLYDKAICCLSLAEEAIQTGDVNTKTQNLTRVLDIIHELTVSVNPVYEPIATNLFSLYSYMSQRVLKGCIQNDVEAVRDVAVMMKDLRPAWEQAVREHPVPPAREELTPAGGTESVGTEVE
jgi:flagellar protein FliS